jgi:hypothetical protein
MANFLTRFFETIQREIRELFTPEPPEQERGIEPPRKPEPPREPPRRPPPREPIPPSRDEPMRVILEQYGYVMVDISNPHQRSVVGAYYNAVGWMLKGGSEEHDYYYYAQKIEDMDGEVIDGVVVDGPSYLIGQRIRGEPLETDIAALINVANAGDFSENPYESWSR